MSTTQSPYDCTGAIGPLFISDRPVAWRMNSFDRPAMIFWGALARELNARGWSDARIKEWLQSKSPRWALDGDLGDQIEALGTAYADVIAPRA